MNAETAGSEVLLDGRPYVLLPQEEFERLQRAAGTFTGGEIGSGLRSRRHRLGLTLKQTSARAGIRLETLSRIETGRTNPSARTVQAVLRALDAENDGRASHSAAGGVDFDRAGSSS